MQSEIPSINEKLNLKYDVCVIGAGAGGLSVAAGCAMLGLKVVIIEKDKMGGDCLNSGCIPSKSLLNAAFVANHARLASYYGLGQFDSNVNMKQVMSEVAKVIDNIAPNDSVERFERLGCTVLQDKAKFTDSQTVLVGNQTIKAKRFVIATGSRPFVPPIPGLKEVSYLTNETIFHLTEKPSHLLVIGGGPIGIEMAQAFLDLGVKVTLLEVNKVLPKDDQELVQILVDHLSSKGLVLEQGIQIKSVQNSTDGQIEAKIEKDSKLIEIKASHCLVATGRLPNTEELDLDKAGVILKGKNIAVDASLKTSNRRIYAMGDVAGPYAFTHIAGYHASIIIRHLLFWLPAKVDYECLPWVTFTSPELAQLGMQEAHAKALNLKYTVLRAYFNENDRAQTEKDTIGLIKVIVNKKGHVLGVSILGHSAGELLAPWILMMQNKLPIQQMASAVFPYPTRSECNKRVAAQFFTNKLFSDKTKTLVRFLFKLLR